MSSTPFSCVTCQVVFSNSEIHRDHYKSDWHRYNLKRKVAELPPVSTDEFQERLSLHILRSQKVVEVPKSCSCCKKHFSSTLTYENHLKSKKHQEALALEKYIEAENVTSKYSIGDSLKHKKQEALKTAGPVTAEEDVSDDDDEEWEDIEDDPPLGPEDCLFCSFKSDNLIANVKHMTKRHSFFIPDVEFLVDLEGLLTYLAEKVSCGNMCLWCDDKGKRFHTTKSVQQHMIDKGHCKILYESETLCEFADFYDYSSSYPDADKAENSEEVDIDVLDDEGYELVLPSGATIGHRSLMRYYRQNVPPNRQQHSRKLIPVLAQYRALGWKQTPREVIARHARDVNFMQTIRAKQYMKQGIKNNKLNKHIHTQIRW